MYSKNKKYSIINKLKNFKNVCRVLIFPARLHKSYMHPWSMGPDLLTLPGFKPDPRACMIRPWPCNNFIMWGYIYGLCLRFIWNLCGNILNKLEI